MSSPSSDLIAFLFALENMFERYRHRALKEIAKRQAAAAQSDLAVREATDDYDASYSETEDDDTAGKGHC